MGIEEELTLVQEMLQAHAFWRSREMQIDLVILNHKESGYAQELQGQIHRLITHMEADSWLNRRGGIFLLVADNMSEADQTLLATAARVVLDASEGALEQQLQRLRVASPTLPIFAPMRSQAAEAEPTPPVARPDGFALR